jgi:hypothetical protein
VDASAYRKSLLAQPQGEIALVDLIRNFSHWFFDLLRNFVLVGGLRFFAEKSGSAILWSLHAIALFVIVLYCLSYADQWYVNIFGFLENKRLAHRLNRLVNVSVAAVLLFAIWWGADVILDEIAHAHL